MSSSTYPPTQTANDKNILTRSGMTLTPLHAPRPRRPIPLAEWIHTTRDSDEKAPTDWEANGWGPNLSSSKNEIYRTRVPVQFGQGMTLPQIPAGRLYPPNPVFFCTDSMQGAVMDDVLRYRDRPEYLERLGVHWSRKVEDFPGADRFLLRIQCPGAARDWIYDITSDGTYGTIMLAVVEAYRTCLTRDAPQYDLGEHGGLPWYFWTVNRPYLRLQGLYWAGRTGTIEHPLEIYEAEVHLVHTIDLKDDFDRFLEASN